MNYNNFKTKCEALGKKYEVFVDTKYNDMSAWGLQDWFCETFGMSPPNLVSGFSPAGKKWRNGWPTILSKKPPPERMWKCLTATNY